MDNKFTLSQLSNIVKLLNIPKTADIIDVCTGLTEIYTPYSNITYNYILKDIKAGALVFRLNTKPETNLTGALYYQDIFNDKEYLTFIR